MATFKWVLRKVISVFLYGDSLVGECSRLWLRAQVQILFTISVPVWGHYPAQTSALGVTSWERLGPYKNTLET